jgi:hypothetical protein
MTDEIELVSTNDGLALIGDGRGIDRFLTSHGLDTAPSRELDMRRLGSRITATGTTAAQVGTHLAENSGRWLKVTKESAAAIRNSGLMPVKGNPTISHAIIGQPGKIEKWVQIEKYSAALTAGPVALPALAMVMSQQAMQQQFDQINAYLETIDEKVDDILRAHKDAAIADMIGAELIIDDALVVREKVGRVSAVTWSKVQSTSFVIARTQAYALRQIEGLAEKLEKKRDLGDLGKATREIEPQVREWLAVIARSFQLQDASSILELDRVLDAEADDWDKHRIGLDAARRNRLDLITRNTSRLLERMDKTISLANSKVLFNPFDSPAAVRSSSEVATRVLELRTTLDIDDEHEETQARRWRQAAKEAGDKALQAGRSGAVRAKRLGVGTASRTADIFHSIDTDGDGVPDTMRAAAAANEAGSALKDAASGVAGAFGTLFQHKKKGHGKELEEKLPETPAGDED